MEYRVYRVGPTTIEPTAIELYTWAEQEHLEYYYLKVDVCIMFTSNVFFLLLGFVVDIFVLRTSYIEQRSFGYTLAVTVVPTVLINTLSLSWYTSEEPHRKKTSLMRRIVIFVFVILQMSRLLRYVEL